VHHLEARLAAPRRLQRTGLVLDLGALGRRASAAPAALVRRHRVDVVQPSNGEVHKLDFLYTAIAVLIEGLE